LNAFCLFGFNRFVGADGSRQLLKSALIFDEIGNGVLYVWSFYDLFGSDTFLIIFEKHFPA